MRGGPNSRPEKRRPEKTKVLFLGAISSSKRKNRKPPKKEAAKNEADDGKTDIIHFFSQQMPNMWAPVPIATRHQYKIWVYLRSADTHARHMRKFQLHRHNDVREDMIQNNQPEFELTKKGH